MAGRLFQDGAPHLDSRFHYLDHICEEPAILAVVKNNGEPNTQGSDFQNYIFNGVWTKQMRGTNKMGQNPEPPPPPGKRPDRFSSPSCHASHTAFSCRISRLSFSVLLIAQRLIPLALLRKEPTVSVTPGTFVPKGLATNVGSIHLHSDAPWL